MSPQNIDINYLYFHPSFMNDIIFDLKLYYFTVVLVFAVFVYILFSY